MKRFTIEARESRFSRMCHFQLKSDTNGKKTNEFPYDERQF